ncbi:MAG: dihydropteroate synthase [Tepidisphaeraceae bacterium]
MNAAEFDFWLNDPHRRTLVMGILNLTPDSFSDGGKFSTIESAVEHALTMAEAGADWLDVGGESTRPGSEPVPPDEQIRRTIPVIRHIRAVSDILISIDTTRGSVAEAALDAGANVVNDISAGRDDPEMFPMLARRKVAVVLSHMQGTPRNMQENPVYEDVTAEVSRFLLQRRDAAVDAGIESRRILLDPGLGFGKNLSHNLKLMTDTNILAKLGHPLVVGPSRKSFIGRITGESRPEQRIFGSIAACAVCAWEGAAVLRVHDVLPMVQTIRMVQAIAGAKSSDFLKD